MLKLLNHVFAVALSATFLAAPLTGQAFSGTAEGAATQSTPASVSHAPGVAEGASPSIAPAAASLLGTVLDTNNDPVPNATVVLLSPGGKRTTLVTGINGFFEFQQLPPGGEYRLVIKADGFDPWSSDAITLEAGKVKIVTGSSLKITQAQTVVDVRYSAEEVAIEEIHAEEHQRVFGVIPNFYVVYAPTAEPMTAKLKFRLALKVSTDMVTAAGILTLSSIQQAADTPDFQQGWKGYGQRVGANAADGFANIMIGGAILPSLLHQDPRYFYKGEGSTRSRLFYAMKHPFVCKGDNGKWQANYSSMGGDLFQASLSNAYYPSSNRGVGLVFGNFAINTAERVLSAIVQEFVLGKYTTRGKH